MDKLRINKFRKRAEKTGISVEKQLKDIQSGLFLNPDEVSGIYAIHSKVNDFIYIGSAARTFSLRWKEHIKSLQNLSHTNGLLQFLYCKYGLDNLGFYMIINCPPEECLMQESDYVHEIIPELNLNALIGTIGFDKKHQNDFQDWKLTKEGKNYKKNTLITKRQKWLKTQVGRDCAQQDIKNLRKRLNESNKTLDEKCNEILNYCREYFPDLILPNEVLTNFINYEIHFEPIWEDSEQTKVRETKPVKNKEPIEKNLNKLENIIESTEKEDMPVGCLIITVLIFLFSIWIYLKIK